MDTQPLSLTDLIDMAMRRKWYLLLPALTVMLLVAGVALTLPAVYKSSATVLVERQEIPEDFVVSTVTTYLEQRVQAITQRILSTRHLMEIRRRLNLFPDLLNQLSTDEIVSRMRSRIKVEPISVETINPRTGRHMAATTAVVFSYEGRDPHQVQMVAETIVSAFLEANLAERQRQTAEASTFLTTEMRRVKIDLEAAERRLAEFKKTHITALPEMLQVNLQTVNTIDHQMARIADQLRALEERQGYLRTKLASVPKTGDMRLTRLQQLEMELVALKTKFTDDYPDVKKLKQEIIELKGQQLAAHGSGKGTDTAADNPAHIALAAQLSSTEAEIASLTRQRDEMSQRLADYHRRLEETPVVEEAYNDLLIQRNNTRAKYEDLMRKVMEANVAHGLEKEQKGERFTLIEPAILPTKPFKPNRLAILAIGLVLGLLTGVGCAALREVTDVSVRGAEELVRDGILPVLASIPVIPSPIDRRIIHLRRLATGVGALLMVAGGVVAVRLGPLDPDSLWSSVIRRLLP